MMAARTVMLAGSERGQHVGNKAERNEPRERPARVGLT